MLVSFSSPRRVALLAVLVLFTVIILYRNSQYSSRSPSKSSSITSSSSSSSFSGARPVHRPDPEKSYDDDRLWHEPAQIAPLLPDPKDHLVALAPKPDTTTSSVAPAVQHPTHAPAAKPKNYLDDKITPVKHLAFQDQQDMIQDLIEWQPLNTEMHWPSWDAYANRDYDPNRWEGFNW